LRVPGQHVSLGLVRSRALLPNRALAPRLLRRLLPLGLPLRLLTEEVSGPSNIPQPPTPSPQPLPIKPDVEAEDLLVVGRGTVNREGKVERDRGWAHRRNRNPQTKARRDAEIASFQLNVRLD